jgi:hypothetical protein
MPALVSFAMLPFALGFVLAGTPRAALSWFVPAYVVANMYVGPLWSTAQSLASPSMRATASAVLLLVTNVAGLALGPFAVGLLNDALAGALGPQSIRYSLLAVTAFGGLAGVFFWAGSRTLREDLASRPA